MITTTLSIILFLIFTLLGGFHFYWLFGGVWGAKSVIPTKDNNSNTIAIPKFATLIVAIGLSILGLMYLVKCGLINIEIPSWIANYIYWFIPGIFIIRAIGEFNYVGFFKKIKHTDFAKADSKLFSPLCLAIGIMGILVQMMK